MCTVACVQWWLYTPQEDTFISEVEVIRAQLLEQDVTIEGEFLSDQQMKDEGFSEPAGPQALNGSCLLHLHVNFNPRVYCSEFVFWGLFYGACNCVGQGFLI